MSQFLYRLGDEKYNTTNLTMQATIKRNIVSWGAYIPKIFIGILFIYVLIGKSIYIRKVNEKGKSNAENAGYTEKENLEKVNFYHILIFLIISIYPFIWYGIIKNHSYIHIFFTYRNISIFILNIQLALAIYLNLIGNKSEIKKE